MADIKTAPNMQSMYSGSTYGGLPTSYWIPNLPPYAVPPHAAPPLRPTPTPWQAQLPPSPMSQQQSPRHSLTVEDEELMQLALAMSMSEAAVQSDEAAATAPLQEGALQLQQQPADRHTTQQRHHHCRAETLSGWDAVSLRCLAAMDDWSMVLQGSDLLTVSPNSHLCNTETKHLD